MEDSAHVQEVSKRIQHFFEKKFPLEEQIFKTKDDLLNYYVDKEIELNRRLLADVQKRLQHLSRMVIHSVLADSHLLVLLRLLHVNLQRLQRQNMLRVTSSRLISSQVQVLASQLTAFSLRLTLSSSVRLTPPTLLSVRQ